MRARRRNGLLIGLVALLPLIGFAGFAVVTSLASYRAADETRLRSMARALASAVDAELGRYVAALETLAISPLLDDPVDVDALEARLRLVGDAWGGWIALIDQPPDYQILASTRRVPGAPLPSAIPPGLPPTRAGSIAGVFRDGRPAFSDLFVGPVSRRPVLTAMVAVDRPGQPRRVLALAFPPEALRALLARQDLPPGGFSAIADGQLQVLGYSLDPEGHRVGASAPDWIAGAVEGRQSTLIVGPGWRGHDNVYAVERLSRAPRWTVVVAEPLSIQRTSAFAAVGWLGAGGAALGLGLAVLVWSNRREAVRDARREADALRAGRAEVDRLLGGLPVVIFLRDVLPDGTTRLIARKGDIETVMGWPAATFAGVDSLQQWEDLPANDYHAFFERVAREGTGIVEYRMRQPDGSWRHLRSRCRLLSRRRDGSGEIVGYILDVSAEREAQARAMSAGRLASLGEMAAGLAHEMKQPLQSISLAAEVGQIAAVRGDAANVDKRFALIIEQTRRTADMIEHLRRFARGTEDGAPPQAVPLAAAVEGALELARSALRDASIDVEVALGDPPPVVCGQEVLLEQVLSNLLLNARDALAARSAGAPRWIRLAAAPGLDGTVRMTVADTGGGIAPEVMARLFEPFVTTKGPDKGTGLGLSICHGLVMGMGGSIEAHNNSEGAVFTITLQAA